MKRKIIVVFLLLFSLFGCKRENDIKVNPFTITYFYNQTCPHCKQLKEEFIKKVEDKYEDSVTIIAYDIDEKESLDLYDQYIGLYDEKTNSWIKDGLLEGVDKQIACYERIVPLVVVDHYYAFLGYSNDYLEAYMQDINLALQGRKLSTGDVSNERWLFKKNN